jgi:hypothetical protein
MVIVPKPGGRDRAMRSKGRKRPRAQHRTRQAQGAFGDIGTDANEGDGGVKLWSSTRHGATAGRGFHYQDAVLAWLGTRMLTGELQLDRLVPEGIEDVSCEGPHATQVQVKSRQERVGDYRASEVAQFLLELHHKHADGPTSHDRLHLVLERPFDGHEPADWQTRLTDDPDGSLLVAVRRLAAQRHVNLTDDFLRRTTVVVLPWRTAANQSREAIETVQGVPPAVAEQLVLALRSMMAAIQDENVNPDFSQRRSADGALVRRTILDTIDLIDVESLSAALRTGVCEVLDLDTQIKSDVFYEGVEAQPGHIAAGLPAPRVKETTVAAEALESGRPVLVTGPSGIGKSTVVWATTYTMRHALWYRVRKLSNAEDVQALARLALSCNASAATPVGFVVDGVGIEGISAWDSLVNKFQGRPFVYLIGSCRSEDLYTVERLASCAQVEVALDELTAQEIYHHLSEAGRTTAAHWLEAFRVAGGLTMEYTFLLTQGRRLSEVIHDQVARRVKENRWLELQIIVLVSTAHRWRAALPLMVVTDTLGVDQGQVRQALSRLLMEHLVVEVNGWLLGVHELRSRELSRQVHQVPPPVLAETVRNILMIVESRSLFRVVFHSLVDEPKLDEAVLSALTSRIEGAPEDGAAAFDALRTVDFYRVAVKWEAILDSNNVVPALRSICVSLALIDREHDYGMFKPDLARAIPELKQANPHAFELRDKLLARLGTGQLSELLLAQPSVSALSDLFAALDGTEIDLMALLGNVAPDRFVAMFGLSSLEQVADLFAHARAIDVRLAQYFVELSSRGTTVENRLMQWSPWIIGARLRQEDVDPVTEVRMLHVSDDLISDLHAKAVEIASLALRCMPEAQTADVQILLAGGYPIRVQDYVGGQSQLDRSYDHTDSQIRWNRRRGAVVGTTVLTLAQTRRVATAIPLLEDVSAYLNGLAKRFVTGRFPSGAHERLIGLSRTIGERADLLVVPIEDPIAAEERAGADAAVNTHDHLHTVADGIINNLTSRLLDAEPHWPSLCGYVADTLTKSLLRCEDEEPWGLVGLEAPPASLSNIRMLLADLRIVLAELAFGSLTLGEIAYWTRAADQRSALRQVARRAEARAMRRGEVLRADLENAITAHGVRSEVVARQCADADAVFWPPLQFAIEVSCEDLTSWAESLAIAVEEILAQDSGWGARLRTLVVPKVAGRLVRQLAHSVILSALPDTSLLDSWSTLGDHAVTPLYDAVTSATSAMQAVSAVAELATVRDLQIAPVEFAESMNAQFSAAVQEIETLEVDACITAVRQYLDGLEQRVQRELDDGVSAMPSLAARIAAGAVGEEVTEEYTMQSYAIGLALQWDLNPGVAVQLLAQLD